MPISSQPDGADLWFFGDSEFEPAPARSLKLMKFGLL